jgi:pilus assembly protein Flp/PilA
MTMLKNFFKKEDGQGMVEYGLIIALVSIVVIGALTFMGGELGNLFNTIGNSL